MCNLYSETKGQTAIRALFRTAHDRTGNLPPPGFPRQRRRSSAIGSRAESSPWPAGAGDTFIDPRGGPARDIVV